jgi:hypothetical protein
VKKIHLLARLFLAVAAVSLTVSAGWAHHGWSWAVDEQSTLEGTIKDVSMAPPHPSLHVTDEYEQRDLGQERRILDVLAGLDREQPEPGHQRHGATGPALLILTLHSLTKSAR